MIGLVSKYSPQTPLLPCNISDLYFFPHHQIYYSSSVFNLKRASSPLRKKKMEESKKSKIRVNILKKTWERCKSFNSHGQQSPQPQGQGALLVPSSTSNSPPPQGHDALIQKSQKMLKSKSLSSLFPRTPTTPRSAKWVGSKSIKGSGGALSTPRGCLSVYVGPEKERFVIKVKCTNHPLFKMLLEEAEMEYGYSSNGPIVLPCDVDMFIKVLFEMDSDRDDHMIGHGGCSPMMTTRTSYHPLSPSNRSISLL